MPLAATLAGATVVVSASAGLLVTGVARPSAVVAVLLQTVDGRSLLWQWVNNVGNVVAVLTVAVWLVSRVGGRLGGRTARRDS
ncbi:MAG: hypothetical protein E6J41_13445 [Chloroflexi bacterium]|nr:MAG: hypothetical protein E6J41_13445 [Chloroflexota bacterium]